MVQTTDLRQRYDSSHFTGLNQSRFGRVLSRLELRLESGWRAARAFEVCRVLELLLGTPLDVALQELRIESFFPADEATRTVLNRLVEEAF